MTQAYMSSLFAILSMFFIVWFPTRSWNIPARKMPTNYIALLCCGMLFCAFAYLRADFLLVQSSVIRLLSERAALILERFDSWVVHNNTVVNVLKMGYVITSIGFEIRMKRTRRVTTNTPISGELRTSSKLDSSTVKAIHNFAEGKEKELLEYVIIAPSSVNDSPEEISNVAVVDDSISVSEGETLTATTAVSIKNISASAEVETHFLLRLSVSGSA